MIDKSIKIGKVVVDRDICIGAGPCAVLAPNTFKIVNGKAEIIDITTDSVEDIIDAAKSCPVLAITVYDENGTVIYPK